MTECFFKTARLVARRFEPCDVAAFVRMRSDPEVARYQNWENFSEADGREFLSWVAERSPGEIGWFQFALETEGGFIGDCGLKIMESDQRLGQIGYTIARDFWNQGFATEAILGLLEYTFTSLPLHRVTASVDPCNAGSIRVLEKAGFRKEAHFRRSEWFKGQWADDAIYAILREEWGDAHAIGSTVG
jgi:RimJ/RimL family protein N-acetyltransferase